MVDHQLAIKKTLYQCKVCQAPASHVNYGAITCAPCKMFFKRNAQSQQNKFHCTLNGLCQIDVSNRHICPSCRLKKCFQTGMQIELIRGPTFKKNIKRKKPTINNHQISTINLLQTNQSIFSYDQSLLFSSSTSDQYHHQALLLAEQYLFQQNILPLKYRFKSSSLQTFLSTIFIQIGYLFVNNEHFHSLHFDDRRFLVDHQLKYVLIFSSSMIFDRSHLVDYVGFQKSLELFFGRVMFRSNDMFNMDIVYMKLSLRLICFCLFDYEERYLERTNDRQCLMNMENMYVELLWKYLFYVYDEKQGVKYLLNLIRYLLNMINDLMISEEKQVFMDMVNRIIKETVQSLNVNKP